MHQSIEEAIAAYREGKFVLVADDASRENEGDLIIAASYATTDKIAFMLRYTSGILCVSMMEEHLRKLQLPQMVQENTEPYKTAFTVSVDAKRGITTGISASDRARTIAALIDPASRPQDLCRPGHVFPLQYTEGGTLKRAGHTEAAVDLAMIASLFPAGVISEVVNDDGTVAKGEQLFNFAKEHRIPFITIEQLIRYRRKSEKLVRLLSCASMPTEYGLFKAYVYESLLDGIEHMALVKGDIKGKLNVLVRVHSECLTGDVFGSKRCDCGAQLSRAMELIASEECGVIIYLRGHEGRGIGLAHKLRAYSLQESGRDTVEANLDLGLPIDSREYGIGAHMLADLGLTTICLITNNPAKYSGLAAYDLSIVERITIPSPVSCENERYLKTKIEKLGHTLHLENLCNNSLLSPPDSTKQS